MNPSRNRFSVSWRPTPTQGWLGVSLLSACLYRLPALANAFAASFVVQDDARQHVFWMQRFADADLFPGDLLADYFQTVAPKGYTLLYQLLQGVGLSVWTANKLLPIVIAIVSTAFAFGIALQLTKSPLTGFTAALCLNQTLLVRDDIDSATPAAFIYPLFLAFLYFVLKEARIRCALSVGLMGVFYPQGVLVMAGVLGLRLLRWRKGRLRLSSRSVDYGLWATGWSAAFLVLLPHILYASPFEPVVTVAQGREMFALSDQGWSEFFVNSPVDYWICGKRSGLFPPEWCGGQIADVPLLWLLWVVPLIGVLWGRSRLPGNTSYRFALLWQVGVASMGCFIGAHLLLFQLHLPNRYTEHSFRMVGGLSMGLALGLWLTRSPEIRRDGLLRVKVGLGCWTVVPLLIAVLAAGHDFGNYTQGAYPALYTYFQHQPKHTVIASLTAETNNLPSFAQRSIFVGAESYTLPYHLGYYAEVKGRTVALIEAQYSPEASVLKAFLQDYPITHWLLHQQAFTPEWMRRSEWLQQYDHATPMIRRARSGQTPALLTIAETCVEIEIAEFRVLDASCLRSQLDD